MRMEIIKRDDTDFELTFKDKDENPINLTDSTVFFTVKRHKTDSDEDAVISKEITEFDDPEEGVAVLSISKFESNISVGDYWFDIQLKNILGKISSSCAGKFIVNQDITVRVDSDES